jgi:hypothetical protein
MTSVVIGVLIVLVGYLAVRLQSARAENETLRAAVISLKRRLVQHRT